MSEELKLCSRHGNLAVVHLPGRAFPAIAVQRDTLVTLVSRLRDAVAAGDKTAPVDRAELDDVIAEMQGMLEYYKDVVISQGMQVPWPEA